MLKEDPETEKEQDLDPVSRRTGALSRLWMLTRNGSVFVCVQIWSSPDLHRCIFKKRTCGNLGKKYASLYKVLGASRPHTYQIVAPLPLDPAAAKYLNQKLALRTVLKVLQGEEPARASIAPLAHF